MGLDLALIDPSYHLVIAVATLTVFYGAQRSLDFYLYQSHSLSAQDPSGSELSIYLAVLMPVAGSLVLLLLFWFVAGLYYVLLGLFVFASIAGVTFVVYPAFEAAAIQLCPTYSIRVRWKSWIDEDVTPAAVLSVVSSLFLIIVWLFVRSLTFGWIVTNALALCLVVTALSALRLPSLLVSTALLGLFFVYDIFWVFLSPYFFGESVMVAVATNVGPTLPMVLNFPRLLTGGNALLGLGDMILPGLFICFLKRFDYCHLPSMCGLYFPIGLLGYVVGLELAWIAVVTTGMGQPALLYLVPCTLLPSSLLAYHRGEVRSMWTGMRPRDQSSADIDSTSSDIVYPPNDIEMHCVGSNEEEAAGTAIADVLC